MKDSVLLVLLIVAGVSLSVFTKMAALFIKCFYDENIIVTKGRMLLSFLADLAFVGMFFLIVIFIDQREQTLYWVAIVSVVVISIALQTLVFFLKRGRRIKYYIESLILYYLVLSLSLSCMVCIGLITVISVLPAANLALEDTLNINFVNSMYVFAIGVSLLLEIPMCLWLYFGFVRKKIYLAMRGTDTVIFFLYVMISLYCSSTCMNAMNGARSLFIAISQNVFALIFLIFVPIMIINGRKTAYFNEMSTRNEQFLEAELTASNAYRQSQEDTRAFRHDMNNNLTVVAALMDKENYSEAAQYLNDLRGKLSSFSPRVVTGDDMLDALISSKIPVIESKGISFKINGVIDGSLGWKPIDVCAVFANMLDNAVEACDRMSEDSQKLISVRHINTVNHIERNSAEPCTRNIFERDIFTFICIDYVDTAFYTLRHLSKCVWI